MGKPMQENKEKIKLATQSCGTKSELDNVLKNISNEYVLKIGGRDIIFEERAAQEEAINHYYDCLKNHGAYSFQEVDEKYDLFSHYGNEMWKRVKEYDNEMWERKKEYDNHKLFELNTNIVLSTVLITIWGFYKYIEEDSYVPAAAQIVMPVFAPLAQQIVPMVIPVIGEIDGAVDVHPHVSVYG